MNCHETILNDIVLVEIYRASDSAISLPPTISHTKLTETTGMFSNPVLKTGMAGENAIQLADRASLRVTNARQMAGNIYTHDLQLSVLLGRPDAENVVNTLEGVPFHLVCTRASGDRFLCYSLPNGSSLDVDSTHAAISACMLKARILSMSNVITLNHPA
jgi:hypothetical protein